MGGFGPRQYLGNCWECKKLMKRMDMDGDVVEIGISEGVEAFDEVWAELGLCYMWEFMWLERRKRDTQSAPISTC